MKVQIFENLETLQEYLKDKKMENVHIKFQSEVVESTKTAKGREFVVVDRFFVIEK